MLTAKAAAPPRLSRSPRLSFELALSSSSGTSATGIPSFRLDSLAECASCKALYEPVEERVVEECQGDRRDDHSRHERLPEEDVTANQVVRNAGRHRPLLRGGNEREGVDELVHAQREGEDDGGEDARQRDREDDQEERLQTRSAVDQRSVLELLRNRLEEPHQEPRCKRHRERGIDEDQRP